MQLLSYSEGLSRTVLVLEVNGITIEITASKGVFGNISIDYRELEDGDN